MGYQPKNLIPHGVTNNLYTKVLLQQSVCRHETGIHMVPSLNIGVCTILKRIFHITMQSNIDVFSSIT